MGTTLRILCPIWSTPLPIGLRGRLGQKYRKGKEEGETKEKEEMKQRQEVKVQEKQIFDPNYYPPSPICAQLQGRTPWPSEKSCTRLGPEKTTNAKHNEKENKTEEDRRIMLELLDEENDLDYYSD